MDVHQLVAAITASANPDASIRKAGEEALKQQSLCPGGIVSLLHIANEESLDPAVRQVSAITLKNAVKKDWEDRESRPSRISGEEKNIVRPLLLEGLIRAPPTVRSQLEESVKTIVASDFPERWPSLIPSLASSLSSGDQGLISGALRILRIVVRKYEFRDDDERAPLFAVIDATFPATLSVFQSLLGNPSPSPDLAELLKICCKIFWSSCYLRLPPIFLQEAQLTGWMAALLGLAGRPVPTEGAPVDLELRKQWPWWKAKKWVYNVVYRLFTRYGDPWDGCPPSQELFAKRWKPEYALQFLGAVLQELSAVAHGGWVAPRVSNILFQFLSEAVNKSYTWKVLKPHVPEIVLHAVMPVLSFDDEDAEMWAEDPQEYVRKGYDVIEDIYSSKTAAMTLLQVLCRSRKKSQLDPLMSMIVTSLNELGPAARDPMASALARRLDGALLAIGSIARILKLESKYSAQLGPMLTTHVIPLFSSPHGHLRAKAAWLAGLFSDSPFPEGTGRGPTFSSMLQCVINALDDSDLPVRVDAGVAIRSFIEEIDVDDLGPLRPFVPKLLQRYLELSQEAGSEELTESLKAVVERFGTDIGPYAVGVVTALVQQFWKVLAEESANGGDDNNDDEDAGSGALAGFTILDAISTVLGAVSTASQLFPQFEEILFPVLDKYTSAEGSDICEEITELITCITVYSPVISHRMWSLYPRLVNGTSMWGPEYWEDLLVPLDNFISRGPDTLLSAHTTDERGAQVSLLDATNAVIQKALAPAPAASSVDKNHDDDDDEIDYGNEFEGAAIQCAAELISVILQNCKGRVDNCLGPYMTLVVGQLASGKKFERHVEDALLLAGTNALYYNAASTLQLLSASGLLSKYMGALAIAVSERRKSGTLRRFPSKREKKAAVLGLISVLGVPLSALPAEVAASLGQIAGAAMHVLLALKAQEEEAEGQNGDVSQADSGSDGLDGLATRLGGPSGNESDDDDSGDDGRGRGLSRYERQRALDDDEDDWGDSEDDWWDDDADDEILSPLDAVSPYVYFAETLQRVQATDAAAFAAITTHMDEGTKAAVLGMMAYASGVQASAAAPSTGA